MSRAARFTVVFDPSDVFTPGDVYDGEDVRGWLDDGGLAAGMRLAADGVEYVVRKVGRAYSLAAESAPPTTISPLRTWFRVLHALDRLTTEADGVPPSYVELGAAVGLSPSNAYFHVKALEGRDLVERRPGVRRGVTLTDAGRALLEQHGEGEE